MFFDKEIETASRSKMQSIQLERLKRIVTYAYDNVKLYKDKFDKIGLKPKHIQTLKDIELIPYTTKDDLRDNYPYGMMAVSMDDIVRVHASSGTTGKPIVVGYTKQDIDMWSDNCARLIVAAGGRKQDIVQISFGYGLFTGAFGMHQGWEKVGATVIPVSTGNTERQIMIMKDFMATALVSTPSYALYLAETMKKEGYTKDDFKLRIGLFGSEASTPEMHEQIKNSLNVLPTDNYGLSEIIGPGVSGECELKCGMHINEDHFYAEIFDIQNNRAVQEGEFGELLLTTLTKEGMPVLRYRTKDITRLDYEPCKCGRTTVRMDKIKGRTDDMLIIRGVNVFPSQIEAVLMQMDEVGPHYEITVKKNGFMDAIEVAVEVLSADLLDDFSKLEALKEKVHHNLKVVLQIDAKVRLVEPRGLKRFEGKAKRVIDLRNQN